MKLELHHLAEVGSTNDDVKRRAREGAAEGLLVVADQQLVGRGRQARVWQSPIGNLYASLLLRPTGSLAEWGQLSFLIGLAVDAMLQEVGVKSAQLKWPNDVLIDGKKIAGILLEVDDGALIVGVGCNLAYAPLLPDKPTIDLKSLGVDLGNLQAAELLFKHIDLLYNLWLHQGFSAIRTRWLEKAYGVGHTLIARLADGREETGRFIGIDADGALSLEKADGQTQRILAGDIFFK